MTEPDEALEWAREYWAAQYERDGLPISAGYYRLGTADSSLKTETDAYRAGQAASAKRIKALEEEIAVWNSVFPDLLPDRLKSDKEMAEEDASAKIDAARLEGIRLGLEAAAREAEIGDICLLDPETIAREAVLDQLVSEAQEQGMGYEKEADQ